MTDETENIVFEMLRRIRASQERTEADIANLKSRVSSLDRHFAEQTAQIATLNTRMDRFDERLSRIERRLELVES